MLTLWNVTIAENASPQGGGLYNEDSQERTVLVNTLLDDNEAANCDLVYPVISRHSLDTGVTCGFAGVGDVTGVDAQLMPLEENGGPTATQAILETSPAIDSAEDNLCSLDQRGAFRPVDGDNDGVARCDIGAFEFSPELVPEYGDANCSADVNSIDVALVLQHEAGLFNLFACAAFLDMDYNFYIDSIDASLILQYVAGLLSDLPP
jgi:hypothetical protein